MLSVYLIEFVLVPYNTATGVCEGIENFYTIELFVDIIHVLNILVLFITAVPGDTKLKIQFKEIASV